MLIPLLFHAQPKRQQDPCELRLGAKPNQVRQRDSKQQSSDSKTDTPYHCTNPPFQVLNEISMSSVFGFLPIQGSQPTQ